jgi:protein SCO1
MKRPPLTVPLVLVLLAVASAAAFWPRTDLPATSAVAQASPETTTTQGSSSDEFGGSFSLIDQNGMRRTDMDFRGKYMLIFFGYTYCPDVCPTALAVEAEALDKLGDRAGRIVPIFITVDPKRDTPDKLKSYLSAFDAAAPSVRPNFVGLTGTDEEIAKVADGYGVYYQAHIDGRVTNGESYSIDHSGHTYLMSPEGKFVAYYTQGILPDELATDLMLKVSPG